MSRENHKKNTLEKAEKLGVKVADYTVTGGVAAIKFHTQEDTNNFFGVSGEIHRAKGWKAADKWADGQLKKGVSFGSVKDVKDGFERSSREASGPSNDLKR